MIKKTKKEIKEVEDFSASFITIACCFGKEEIEEKIKKTLGKKLVKILFADMRTSLLGGKHLKQEIYTFYDKKIHLKSIKILEHKPDKRFNRFQFEFRDEIDRQDYYLTLDFLDKLFFQTDNEEILIKSRSHNNL